MKYPCVLRNPKESELGPIVVVHVDGILEGTKGTWAMPRSKDELAANFSRKDLGEVNLLQGLPHPQGQDRNCFEGEPACLPLY